MSALTPRRPMARLESRLGLPALRHRTVQSFRLQPPTAVPVRSWGLRHRAYRTTRRGVGRPSGAVRDLGFALRGEARHDSRPNRVHLRYGLIVHLRLLSTPPCGDAVTFGYGVPDHPDEDLHLADSMRSQAHIGVGRTHWVASLPPPNRTCGSPASGSPVGGLTSMRIDGPGHGRHSGYTTPARQRRRSASESCPRLD